MKKRFTDADKWRDPWFRGLSVDGKLVFSYVLDNCDAAGVWEPDYALANFCIHRDIDWDAVKVEFGGRIRVLEGGKWYLTRFIAFQYGELSDSCPPHRHVIKLLKGYGIPFEYPTARVQDKEKEKEGDKQGEIEGVKEAGVTAELIYAAYPRKTAKQEALRAIRKAMKADAPDRLLERTAAYAKCINGTELQYIPFPATWFNQGRYNDDEIAWNPAGRRFAPPKPKPTTLPEPANWRAWLEQTRPGNLINAESRPWAKLDRGIQAEAVAALGRARDSSGNVPDEPQARSKLST